MSVRTSNHVIIFLVLAVALVMSLVFPSAVLADDGTPPPEETAEAVSPPPDETAEAVSLPPDETAEAVSPDEDAADAVPPEESPPASVAEIVEIMEEAGAVLADGNGDPIPLAAEAAQTALLFPDPIGCPPGVQPVSWGGTGAGCTVSYASIQAAINDGLVQSGWTVYIDPGTFYENVNVNKSVTLQGSGVGVTIVHPGATSTPDLGCGAGSCASIANTVFYITADNVTIRDLTIDGDNPLVASGTVVNGADINVRNGIFGNSADNLVVEDTEVKNTYLRGIQIAYGDSFEIRNNTIQNVDGSPYSIALFNFGGGGVIEGNTINEVGDGIASNWSTGTQVLNNTISNMGTGIHTDNTQASDVISGNTILNGSSNSYGIFVFAPYAPVAVTNNTITNVDVGLTVSGNGWGDTLNTITIDNNKVATNVIGAYVTTDVWGYFFSDVSASFTNNVFTGGDYGFYLESNGSGEYYGSYDCSGAGGDCVLNVTGSGNSITGQNLFAATTATGQPSWTPGNPLSYYGVYNVDLRGNWWGDASGPNDDNTVPDSCGITLDNPAGLGGNVSECILYDPWLVKNPFLPPVVDKVDDEEKGSKKDFPASLIPVTGGQLTSISCEFETSTLLIGDIKVIFSGLCGYEVLLELLTYETLPASLNDGEALLYGLNIILFERGVPVDGLPANAKVIISYPVAGVPMKWSSSAVNPWLALEGRQVDDRFEVDVDSGTFILIGN
ncbi:MAG: right-handed parallel beta-helix repeat-containing protein [Anaerolineales bacterium]|nr:MAG: right-handed parallel beta-helix repeat-containing protein [Anaerolineales bacterium]